MVSPDAERTPDVNRTDLEAIFADAMARMARCSETDRLRLGNREADARGRARDIVEGVLDPMSVG